METLKGFEDSLSQNDPPFGMSDYLVSLWYDGKGDWKRSHEIIQDIEDRTAAWIHAYLHRKEGDAGNARYWYNRAGKSMPDYALQQEWKELIIALI
jgi:hypothetical protein